MLTVCRLILSGFSSLGLFYYPSFAQQTTGFANNRDQWQGLILALIAVIIILALMGSAVSDVFSNIICEMEFVGDGIRGSECSPSPLASK